MKDADDRALRPSTDASVQRVARVYAEALLNAAAKKGEADRALEELESLLFDLFQSEAHFEAFLASGSIGRDRKEKVIQAVFGTRACESFCDFLLVLNHHERLALLRPILVAAREFHDQKARRLRVQVRTAAPLAEDQSTRLLDGLRQTFQMEPVLETKIEPELLGGMVVRVGDWLYDGSVRTRLETIRNQLIARSSHEIQSRRDRFSSANGN